MSTACEKDLSLEKIRDDVQKATTTVAAKQIDSRVPQTPRRKSFADFLTHDARVPIGGGLHGHYHFEGREALRDVVTVIDRVISEKLADAEISLAGGAQFGKTILELNLAAYVTAQTFRNFGLYLPDDDLVEGIVDSKFRPDVVDQIDWFARLTQVGKALNKSGRAVNRKGAFLVTDGQRKSVGMIRGLGKVPTTFSMDVAAMDEVDDIAPAMMKFVRGRLTASDLRLVLKIGTQRVHGRGMNKAWKDGSQGVVILKCPKCKRAHNPEEEFPAIVRLQTNGIAPQLTWSGEFKLPGADQAVATHQPTNQYFLGCVDCGAPLDRTRPTWEHRQPERLAQRNWSFRISQLSIAAIDLSQIVTRFQSAVADPEEMIVFRCDVLGLPQSTAQALTPTVLDRARAIEKFNLAPRVRDGQVGFGGLDMGDRCWLFAREVKQDLVLPRVCQATTESKEISTSSPRPSPPLRGREGEDLRPPAASARLLAAERIPAADVVARAQTLFHQLGLAALFIDERPLVNEARSLALALNGLDHLITWPAVPNLREAHIEFPSGLTWDGRNSRWRNLKCAVVRFTKTKLGAGITQTIVFFEEHGQVKFVPCIECNRFETIDRVVREFLTPAEGVVDILNGQVRETPALLLPQQTPSSPPILATLDAHLITGSEREKETDGSLGDYVDGCENHLLLANGYSKLAEIVSETTRPLPFAYQPVRSRKTKATLI